MGCDALTRERELVHMVQGRRWIALASWRAARQNVPRQRRASAVASIFSMRIVARGRLAPPR
jgi:hypothetical protein